MDDNLPIHCDKVNDILRRNPLWISKIGLLFLSVFLFLFLFFSFIIKYPDTVKVPLKITSETPPLPIISNNNGIIELLLVHDGQEVCENQYLIVLQNSVNFVEILTLKKLLLKTSLDTLLLTNYQQLGQLQGTYNELIIELKKRKKYVTLNFNKTKTLFIIDQINILKKYADNLKMQNDILDQDLILANNQFQRDSFLYKNSITSSADYDKSVSSLLLSKFKYFSSKIDFYNVSLQVSKLEAQKADYLLQDQESIINMDINILSLKNSLINQIQVWEQTNVLKSSIAGRVAYHKNWTVRESIISGEKIISIIPTHLATPLCRGTIETSGAGKVRMGQRVNISIENYPSIEYGMIKGVVMGVSEIPSENKYLVEIALPKGLITYYGKKIPFKYDMVGTGTIITENLTLLDRILNPIRSLLKNV
ncbi:MAG: hypothetical protein EOM90_06535 [Alphaproteobacteria bacterium]|nr:hypothetical protein [Alphaproteobacteria bacterium]